MYGPSIITVERQVLSTWLDIYKLGLRYKTNAKRKRKENSTCKDSSRLSKDSLPSLLVP